MSLRKSFVWLHVASASTAFCIKPSFVSSALSSPFHQVNNLNRSRSSSELFMSTSNAGLSDIGKVSSKDKRANNGMSSDDKTCWRDKIELSAARARKVRGGNYVQLATVDPQTMEPRCRTVVFRGFLQPQSSKDTINETSCVMKMITDGRSNKVEEISNRAKNTSDVEPRTAEMVWWFSKSSEQYRIRGRLAFVGGGDFENDKDELLSLARKQQWGNLSDMAREQFYWKNPGTSYESQAEVPLGGRDDDGKVLPPPNNFLLMLLYPKRVDYLRLTDNFRQIDELDSDTWSWERVNP
eukprot:CAMPEP_0197824892 /NCGR_PEP_ID=MMETSP1437-20131217/2090_1 /TAXON_ID=49252 ORGANISM="Eucampia antarctica, Strain CCMP1452" /NCGR_SAMPLE_ID=MMETSP1437 /ASSEMBLY_ACC=CAM_ASM_001096 /LENGTH=295 /DNA_ID=CAMNT_0043424697 /DNA_START=34 /DNA_END=921 /DNA_ORIENTATION=-